MQAFVSLMLVGGLLLLFAYSIKQRDYEHADRLALLPIEDDAAGTAPRGPEQGRDGAAGSGAPGFEVAPGGEAGALLPSTHEVRRGRGEASST